MSDQVLSGWQFAAGRMPLKEMSPTASHPFDASDFDVLKSHIAEHGLRSPISIKYDRGQNYVRQGHHRRRALNQLGHADAEVHVMYRAGKPSPDLVDARPITHDEFMGNHNQAAWTERR